MKRCKTQTAENTVEDVEDNNLKDNDKSPIRNKTCKLDNSQVNDTSEVASTA